MHPRKRAFIFTGLAAAQSKCDANPFILNFFQPFQLQHGVQHLRRAFRREGAAAQGSALRAHFLRLMRPVVWEPLPHGQEGKKTAGAYQNTIECSEAALLPSLPRDPLSPERVVHVLRSTICRIFGRSSHIHSPESIAVKVITFI